MDAVRLPAEPDVIAPDGSDVRVLVRSERGSMAHFELAAGHTSRGRPAPRGGGAVVRRQRYWRDVAGR
ncbi:MAG TPA: hypothetical protein VF076_07595, partial [Acidimicrobiales bacterium]